MISGIVVSICLVFIFLLIVIIELGLIINVLKNFKLSFDTILETVSEHSIKILKIEKHLKL